MKHPTSSTNLHSTNTRHTRVSFVEATLTRALIVKQGTHSSMIRVFVTIKILVLTNRHIILQVSHNSSTVVRSVEITPPQPLPLRELNRADLITYMIESEVQFNKTQEQFNIIQEQLNMDFENEINHLPEILNLRNSNQNPLVDFYYLKGSDEGNNEIDSLTKEPSDTLLMGDEVISTTPAMDNDKFIKYSVDDLVPVPRESEVTSVCDDLECNMPVNTPLPTTDVREEDFRINSPLGEQVVDFFIENVDVANLPRHMVKQLFGLLVNNLSSTKRMYDEPLGDDSKPRSYDVTFSNPLFDFNDDFTLCNDNPLFDEEFEDISSLDPPESTLVIDESTLLVTPLPDSKQFSLR
ncbi:hypothetical protein Tco_0065397 [Tanacetum coccineum]